MDVRPYALLILSLSSVLFPLFILRMDPSILQGRQLKELQGLILWSFLFRLSYSLLYFAFISAYLIVSASTIPKYP